LEEPSVVVSSSFISECNDTVTTPVKKSATKSKLGNSMKKFSSLFKSAKKSKH